MVDEKIGLDDVVDMRKNPSTIADDLSEKERIQLLRNEGSDVQKKGIESIFGGNKWKPQKKRENMWVEKLDEGRKPVRELIRSHLRDKGKEVPTTFNRISNRVKKQREVEKKAAQKTSGQSKRSSVKPDEKGMTTLDQFR